MPEAWWPQVEAAKADPLKSFLALRVMEANLEILRILLLDLNKRCFNKLQGLLLADVCVIPKSLVACFKTK